MENKPLNIAIGADHAGFELKEKIKGYLSSLGHTCTDYGTFSPERADYPDYIHPLASAVSSGDHDYGIVMCGSGNGVSMTANKNPGIRAGLSWKPELARLARAHNDANILALPARFIDEDDALEAVRVFLETPFEGGRHQKRVEKIKRGLA